MNQQTYYAILVVTITFLIVIALGFVVNVGSPLGGGHYYCGNCINPQETISVSEGWRITRISCPCKIRWYTFCIDYYTRDEVGNLSVCG